MKNLISLCIIGLLCSIPVSGQIPSVNELKTEPVTVTTGYSLKLHSTILNEDRTIMISLPDGYNTCTKKYPVLYMLDAQWNFNHTAQNLGWLSSSENKIIPQTIVVGISSGGDKREHDLTPTHGTGMSNGGGGDSLYLFIKKEVIPFVEKNYRTYNYRMLGGVSYGGLFVMNAFVKDPLYFNGYLSISPSMWWDNQIILRKTEELLAKTPEMPTRLYFTMANEGISMGVDSLAGLLKKYAPHKLAWKYDKHPDEIHNTINYKGTWDGIKFLLADWYYPFVDFGTKEKPFSVPGAAVPVACAPKVVKLPATDLMNYSGVYQDSYGRLLAFVKVNKTLLLSCNRLPTLTLYPESKSKFFLTKDALFNDLYLKDTQVQFEFFPNDSLVVTANGNIDCTAKKIIHSPLVALTDNILQKYVGAYVSSIPGNDFQIIKKENALMVLNNDVSYNLYPMSENKFFVLISGMGLEIEFLKDESNNITKVNVTRDGTVMLEAKRKD